MKLTDTATADLMAELKRRGVTGAQYTAYVTPQPLAKCIFCGTTQGRLANMGQRGHRCAHGTGCMR